MREKLLLALAGTFALAGTLSLAPAALSQKYEPNGDIWKYRIPKDGIRGEFDNGDVMGVIAGQYIPTDCSVNVIKDGKIYCFTAAASQTFFKYAPNGNLARARQAWESMKSRHTQ